LCDVDVLFDTSTNCLHVKQRGLVPLYVALTIISLLLGPILRIALVYDGRICGANILIVKVVGTVLRFAKYFLAIFAMDQFTLLIRPRTIIRLADATEIVNSYCSSVSSIWVS